MYNLFKLNDYLDNSVPSLNMFIFLKIEKIEENHQQFQKNYLKSS